MIRQNLTIEDFEEALKALDDELAAIGFTGTIEIRAIGGFALLLRGLRTTGVTADIDTVTPSYPIEVDSAISRVAVKLALPPDWLNNDSVLSFSDITTQEDVEAFESMLDASFDRIDADFSHIIIYSADLPTLIKAKAYACCDIGIGRTSKDLDDLLGLLVAVGVNSADEAFKLFPWFGDLEFAECSETLRKSFPASVITPDDIIAPKPAKFAKEAPAQQVDTITSKQIPRRRSPSI